MKITQLITLQKHDAILSGLSINDFATQSCVYELWQGTVLLYIGTCRLIQFPALPDAFRNSYIATHVPRDKPLDVRIIATGSRTECWNHRGKLVAGLSTMPLANRMARAVGSNGRRIRCVNDGREFDTQAAAATAYGIGQGNLSSHLRQKAGHVKIKGLRFEYV